MIAAVFALVQWIPQLAQAATEPVALAVWGGALVVFGATLRLRSRRYSTQAESESLPARNADRRLASNLAQPV